MGCFTILFIYLSFCKTKPWCSAVCFWPDSLANSCRCAAPHSTHLTQILCFLSLEEGSISTQDCFSFFHISMSLVFSARLQKHRCSVQLENLKSCSHTWICFKSADCETRNLQLLGRKPVKSETSMDTTPERSEESCRCSQPQPGVGFLSSRFGLKESSVTHHFHVGQWWTKWSPAATNCHTRKHPLRTNSLTTSNVQTGAQAGTSRTDLLRSDNSRLFEFRLLWLN